MSFLTIAFQTGAFQEEVAAGEIQEFRPVKAGIAVKQRGKWYIIDEQRMFLTDEELAIVVAAKLNAIKERSDIKEIKDGKNTTITRKKWGKIKKAIAPLQPINNADSEDDDEEAILMLM